jgi:hypothetical protein
MNDVLRDRVVPVLRQRGFRGSMPHFRCVVYDTLRLLTFQFRSSGGSFVVELGHCPSGDFTTSYGAVIPQSKMNITYLSPRSRFRLGRLTRRRITGSILLAATMVATCRLPRCLRFLIQMETGSGTLRTYPKT